MTQTALFGGSFDPIHLGHLILAAEVVDQAGVDHVMFVPAATPPHKGGKEISAANHRLAMVSKAISDSNLFSASDIEIARGGVSYTIDTLRELRENGENVSLIVGADQVLEFETWKDYHAIIKDFPLILTTRKGYPRDLKEGKPYLEQASMVEIPDIGISATEIRARVRDGRSIRYLVPPPVEDYIRKHGLYR